MSHTDFPPMPEGLDRDKLHDVANRLNSSTIHFTRYLRGLRHGDGLTLDRRSLLSLLVFGGPQRMTDIARRELVSLPAASRMVASLEDLGLVERQPDPTDGRAVLISASPAGRAQMDVARGERIEALAVHLAGISRSDLDVLSQAADIMNAIAMDAAGHIKDAEST